MEPIIQPPFCLPEHPDQQPWPSDIQDAFITISDAYKRAVRMIRNEDGEPVELRARSQYLHFRVIPIVEALEGKMPNNPDWVMQTAEAIMSVAVDLMKMAQALESIPSERIIHISPIKEIKTGIKGRPQKHIDPEWLRDAFGSRRRLSRSAIAKTLGIHRHTLRKRLRNLGIFNHFSSMSDIELQLMVSHIKTLKPNAGLRYIRGFLARNGIKVQQKRVWQALIQCDAVGVALRSHSQIERRREYKVARPNSVWHIDGHHKLIRWGIVVHGMVDGYCRTIVGLKGSTNNRASTVLNIFLGAVSEYGAPLRLQGDRGGENIEVSVWMIMHQGPNRGSFMWGGSTRNTQIERSWVDFGQQVGRRWRAFFTRLEKLHYLDVEKPWHLWILHTLFLDQLNHDIEDFKYDWNYHPLSRKGHDKSPSDIRFEGETKFGKYNGGYLDTIHPDTMQKYSNRATEDPATPNTSANNLPQLIADDQEIHVRHDAIQAPKHTSPFQRISSEEAFWKALEDIDKADIIPTGFGVAQNEWEDGNYPEVETLRVARKDVDIQLPFAIWWPRAVRWARTLDLVMHFRILEES